MFIYMTVLVVFNVLIKHSRSEECVLDSITNRIPMEDAWDRILHKELLNNYETSQPPRNQSCVPVKVHLQLKTFSIDEYEGVFTTKLWTRQIWNDERLTWSPEKYGGVKKIVVRHSDIWTPSLTLLNSIDPYFYNFVYGECMISNTGEILCVLEVIFESFCSSKLRDWPYDVQNCSVQLGSDDKWSVSRFHFGNKAISLFPAEYGTGWNIMGMHSKEDPDSDIRLSITMTMERQATGLVVIIVTPCIILCTLTVTSIFLNVNDYIRLGFLFFTLVSQFLFLIAVDMFLPKHSTDTPVVLFFIRDSLILTVTSAIDTFMLSKIVKRKTVPFEWLSSVSSSVFNSYGQYLIFPRWCVISDCEDVNVKNREVWINIANILNSVYLIIVVINYSILFSVYMPKLPPAEYLFKHIN